MPNMAMLNFLVRNVAGWLVFLYCALLGFSSQQILAAPIVPPQKAGQQPVAAPAKPVPSQTQVAQQRQTSSPVTFRNPQVANFLLSIPQTSTGRPPWHYDAPIPGGGFMRLPDGGLTGPHAYVQDPIIGQIPLFRPVHYVRIERTRETATTTEFTVFGMCGAARNGPPGPVPLSPVASLTQTNWPLATISLNRATRTLMITQSGSIYSGSQGGANARIRIISFTVSGTGRSRRLHPSFQV